MFQPYGSETTPGKHNARRTSSLSMKQPKFIWVFASNFHALSKENHRDRPTEMFRSFPQTLQANIRTVPRLGYEHFITHRAILNSTPYILMADTDSLLQ
jgi:hypothetical protein